jgi:2-oxoadipate dioxygenase/decarboxylase-like protein
MGLLDQLWDRYAAQVPYARTFVELARGTFRNDHVAFRSLKGRGGIEPFAAFFEQKGWTRRDAYDFPDAHLDAIYLAKPGEPRVFISQLRAEELSPRAQKILEQLPHPGPIADAGSFRAPDIQVAEPELLELERESQYGAWLLLFGREVNHFTASVDDVEKWQRRMKEAGIPMKEEIEGEPGAGLRQTATKAAPRKIRLREREREWPYAYLEVAERNGGFDGFVAAQARQLFEMTKR